MTARAFCQKWMFWTFWRFSAWMSHIYICPIYSKWHLQHDSRNLFPLALFTTFLLRMGRNQTLELRKWPTSFQFFKIFSSFTFCSSDLPPTRLASSSNISVKASLYRQRVATAVSVVTGNFAVIFLLKLTHTSSYKVWHWLSITFRFAV